MNSLSLFGVIIMALSVHGKAVTQNTEAWGQLKSGVHHFGANINKVISAEHTGNYAFSPLSIDITVAMASFGAEGNTKSQLQAALQLPSNDELAKSGYQQAIQILNNTELVDLDIANKIFTSDSFEVKSQYQDILKTYFYSESQSVDFTNSANYVEKINDWTAAHTNNHIPKLVEPGQLDPSTVLFLANAVSFKGKWASPFKSSQTQPKPFYIDATTTKNVDTMHTVERFNYGSLNNTNTKYIELPFENPDVSLYLFASDTTEGLSYLQENFGNMNFGQLKNTPTYVSLSLPKFKITSEFDLQPTLKELGITDMFNNSANFRGINSEKSLKVSSATHKSFIEVNEEGSEASGVTGLAIVTMSLPIVQEFTINKPFFFALVSQQLQTALFVGRVTDPSASA